MAFQKPALQIPRPQLKRKKEKKGRHNKLIRAFSQAHVGKGKGSAAAGASKFLKREAAGGIRHR